MKKIIFLFSLPRSGSTLLQRILMAHQKIDSVSEPWLLLPLFYTLKAKGSLAEYDAFTCYTAIQDFIKELPNKKQDYLKAINFFAQFLYDKATSENADYFLDKTPRYYNIIPEIAEVFPKAKFIFLFRNPLAIMSSIFASWHQGRLKPGNNYQDLYFGPKLLADGYKLLADRSIKVKYENLVNNPEDEIKAILQYLEIDFDKVIIENFYNSNLSGAMGDVNGYKYKRIEAKFAEKWKEFFDTKFRQKYAQKYLNYLGDEILDVFGYNKNELLNNFNSVKVKRNYKKEIFDKFNLMEEWLKFKILTCKIFKKLQKFFYYK